MIENGGKNEVDIVIFKMVFKWILVVEDKKKKRYKLVKDNKFYEIEIVVIDK